MQLDCQNISQIKGNDPPNYDPLKMKEGKLIVDLSIPKICALKMKLTVDPSMPKICALKMKLTGVGDIIEKIIYSR